MAPSGASVGKSNRPVVLIILDGWGIGRDEPGNAILAAHTPTMDRLAASYPYATLRCSGEDVGLPAGQMGNSEVGHLNLGAGFIVYQWITKIDRAIADGSLRANEVLQETFQGVIARDGTLHLIGLVSDGGVHSHLRHLEALIEIALERGVPDIAVHAFTDGRDTSPTAGRGYISEVEQVLARMGHGRIASVSGRYYAMDRDNRWDRSKLAFEAIARGLGASASNPEAAVTSSYARGVTDEFIIPTVIDGNADNSAGILPNDAVIAFNFRADRMRQIIAALSADQFAGFDRGSWRPPESVVTLTQYDDDFPNPTIFPPHDVEQPVARSISEAGLAQFHCAETEKYAHVTYFFNGGREVPFSGEVRGLVPSPKVATYDLAPAMSAAGVTDRVVEAVESGAYPFIIVNYANCDMVGHSGVFSAAVEAVETVDSCLARVLDAVLDQGGAALVTADHGNAEEIVDRVTGGPMTAHTTNPVPVILVVPDGDERRHAALRQDCVLSAVAPTVLKLLDVPVPRSMTSAPLF